VKVKNLTPWVSNELLEKAFSVFGEVSWIPVNSFSLAPPPPSPFQLYDTALGPTKNIVPLIWRLGSNYVHHWQIKRIICSSPMVHIRENGKSRFCHLLVTFKTTN
jgi:hypothetical protein